MEKWNAYTKDMQLTNILLDRDKPIPDGLYHIVCEVLVRHVDGSYLCMRRSKNKKAYPGYYEATAGGSALVGENKYQCIKRELFEETGLTADNFTEVASHINDRAHAVYFCFVCTLNCDKNAIVLQDGETDEYKWVSEKDFIEFINSPNAITTQKARYFEYFKHIGYIKE